MITVHVVRFDHGGESAFYASLPGDDETGKGCGANGAADKNHLVAILLDHVWALEIPRRKRKYSGDGAALPIQVVHGPLGRPHLLSGENRMPAVSFSEGGGRVWAALCLNAPDIGIDAASPAEFQGLYPVHRVFRDQELQHALRLTGGNPAEASALLWSIKEAAVKALGCGFHLVAPREVLVYSATGGDSGSGYTFPVCLSEKAMVRFPMRAGRSIWVRSCPREKVWLSIALLNRNNNVLLKRNVDS